MPYLGRLHRLLSCAFTNPIRLHIYTVQVQTEYNVVFAVFLGYTT